MEVAGSSWEDFNCQSASPRTILISKDNSHFFLTKHRTHRPYPYPLCTLIVDLQLTDFKPNQYRF